MATSHRAYKAFVSSTFIDLKDHRARVINSLVNAGFFVDPMENWAADSDEPKRFSQDRLVGCDVCILLVAFRRGFVPEGETRSITQMEYEAAVKQGAEVLVYQLADTAKWWAIYDEREKDQALGVWRSSLCQKHGVEFFTDDPGSVDVASALTRWMAENKPVLPEPEKRINWSDSKSPYPGLEWFDKDYAPLFFGRDHEVEAVLAKMRKPQGRLLIISGNSGSGKSSLVAAGLWWALVKEGRLPGSQKWGWLRMTPDAGKLGPFVKLAMTLQQAVPHMTVPMDELAVALARDPTVWKNHIATHLTDGQELLLFIDQLEELFTQGYPADTIQSFLVCLGTISGDLQNQLRVVATVSSEFIGCLEAVESICQLLNDGSIYHVPPVSQKALLDIIEKPAQLTGHVFEVGLVEAIMRDTAQEPGNLPLVSYCAKAAV